MSGSIIKARRRRASVAAVAGLAVAAGSLSLLSPGTSSASSHREAPFIAGQPQLDNTDVYAFVSPDKPDSVTLIADWIPFEEPNGGPNFYPWATDARYDINIDSNGDGKPELIYRWTFASSYQNKNTFLYNTGPVTSLTDPDLNFRQTYNLDVVKPTGTTRLLSNAPSAPSFTGLASMPDYSTLRSQALVTTPGGGTSYAGQADDPFFLDLRIFDLLYGADLSETGNDTLKGYNVNTIALQVPKAELALNGNPGRNPVIGVWSTTSRERAQLLNPTNGAGGTAAQTAPEFAQVSRLGFPLVNEVISSLNQKDRFNASTPDQDRQFQDRLLRPEVPKLIEAIYGVPAPGGNRTDLAEVIAYGLCGACGPVKVQLNSQLINQDSRDFRKFAPSDMLRLNMSVAPTTSPDRLGVIAGDVAGFPNGRRLGDDVVDVELRVLEGVLRPDHHQLADTIGDGVDANEVPFGATFPYVALPNTKAVNRS